MSKQAGQPGIDLGAGRVPSVLFRLASPIMVSLFFESLFYLMDTLFVSWLGTLPLAALSLSMPLFYAAFALAKGVSVGVGAQSYVLAVDALATLLEGPGV